MNENKSLFLNVEKKNLRKITRQFQMKHWIKLRFSIEYAKHKNADTKWEMRQYSYVEMWFYIIFRYRNFNGEDRFQGFLGFVNPKICEKQNTWKFSRVFAMCRRTFSLSSSPIFDSIFHSLNNIVWTHVSWAWMCSMYSSLTLKNISSRTTLFMFYSFCLSFTFGPFFTKVISL